MTLTPPSALRAQLRAFDFSAAFLSHGWNAPARTAFTLDVKDRAVSCRPIAEQGGWTVLEVTAPPIDAGPSVTAVTERALREAIDAAVTNLVHHHVLIFLNDGRTEAVWQFSATVSGKRLRRERRFNPATPVEPLVSLLRGMEIPFELLDDEGEVSVTAMNDRMAQIGLYAERVSKNYFNQLAKQRQGFENFLAWVDAEKDRNWYITALLNRLMFIYFIQHKGLMQGDTAYLRHQLNRCNEYGLNFYREFFLPLCFFGFAKPWNQRKYYGGHFTGIPFLNGGLFNPHKVECDHDITPEAVAAGALPDRITIPNAEFGKWLDFFDSYRWTLDEDDIGNDREINPDILGYIFEKYINQKQMGAYYTKEDITGYICRNTIIPRLFDMLAAAGKKGAQAVNPLPVGPHPNLFNEGKGISGGEGIDRYVYPAVKTQERLPTETEREYLARQQRYDGILRDFEDGRITTVNDFITWNLDIERMALDFIAGIQDAGVLRDLYFAGLRRITVLDPTCGSGAFLFAALKVLYPLYAACVRKMAEFHQREAGEAGIAVTWQGDGAFDFANEVAQQLEFMDTPDDERRAILEEFGAELASIREHDNAEYFIYKRIIVDNLFGVDIMEEAVEICKLRLFLKLIAHAEPAPGKDNLGIEPLPDIDFNILCGNTLVGFTTHEQVRQAVLGGEQKTLQMDDTMDRIEEKARAVDALATAFRQAQTARNIHATPEQKAALREALRALEHELNGYLARQYGITSQESRAYSKWLKSHQPFHWYVEYFGTMARGGIEVIVGNPPYLDFRADMGYAVIGYTTTDTRNLYSLILERCQALVSSKGRQGYIVPVSSVSTEGYLSLQNILLQYGLVFSSFDDRPAHLFTGLDKNTLSILLQCPQSAEEPFLFSSRLNRWMTIERGNLFSLLQFHSSPYSPLKGCLPKISSAIESSIWEKLLRMGKPLGQYIIRDSTHQVYYSRKINAFIQVLNFIPEVRDGKGNLRPPSEFKTISVANARYAAAVNCGLNSTLFRWFLDVTTDGSHLNRREIEGFPISLDSFTDDALTELKQLAQRLSEKLIATSETREIRYPHDTLTIQCIVPKHAKPIIDEIDRVLARHYGFTDEELDFIINYDIKYRMGRDV